MLGRRNKSKIINERVVGTTNELEKFVLCDDLQTNLEAINKLFLHSETLITRKFVNQFDESISGSILFMDGMVSPTIIAQDILKPLIVSPFEKNNKDSFIDIVASKMTLSNTVEKTTEFEKLIQAIVYGDTVLLLNRCNTALVLNTKGFTLRSLEEPSGERVLSGPREGFNEGILVNLSLVRRRIRTEKLKMRFMTLGSVTKTKACICYIEGIAKDSIVEELMSRLQKFNLDAALDVNYINECIKDHPHSPFKTIGTTERPDVVAGKLLEGRIALFVDGTPVVLTLPFLFNEYFQSSEDYYTNFFYASFVRFLRYFGFFLTISVPAIYIAIVDFHQEMLPTSLLMSLSISRMGVPFPTIVEAFAMLIVFELLRESGVRMNSNFGSALSIVGALVVGQAAVEAKLVSAPMIIVVGITGITGILIPRLKSVVIILRYSFLVIASALGLYGFMIAVMGTLLYALGHRSFGVRYISDILTFSFKKEKDILIRAPWTKMKTRPNFLTDNLNRMD